MNGYNNYIILLTKDKNNDIIKLSIKRRDEAMIKYSGNEINTTRIIEMSDFVFREISSGVYKVEKDRSGVMPEFVTQVNVVGKLNEKRRVTIITLNNEFVVTNNIREIAKEQLKDLYILKDESLGGILREYVPVDREANVGDYIHVFGHAHKEANGIFKVDSVQLSYPNIRIIYGKSEKFGTYYNEKTYKTLEPTNIIHYNGKRYRILHVFKRDSSAKVILVDPNIITVKENNSNNIIHIAVEPVEDVKECY